jgi:hypothetical protein
MPSGTKFLLTLIPLIIFGGIGFYVFIPHYLKTNKSPEQESIARTLEDVERARKLVAMALATNAAAAEDGRVDVYRALLSSVTDTREMIDLCSRSGEGPTLEEIRDGDYSRFPYQRAEGAASVENGGKPVFWDREPNAKGSRLVALSDGAVFVIPEEKFQNAMRTSGMK